MVLDIITSENCDVDKLIEEIAVAIGELQFQQAATLISNANLRADDVQKQILESYKMQLDFLAAEENVVLDYSLQGTVDFEPVSVPCDDNLVSQEVSESIDNTVESFSNNMDEVRSVAEQHENSEPLFFDEKEEKQNEISLALEQIELLISDKEYDMAEILIALVKSNGDVLQQSKADAWERKIDSNKVLIASEKEGVVKGYDDIPSNSSHDTDVIANNALSSALHGEGEEDHSVSEGSTIDRLFSQSMGLETIEDSLPSQSIVKNDSISNEMQHAYSENVSDLHQDVSGLMSPTEALGAFDISEYSFTPSAGSEQSVAISFSRQGFYIGNLGMMVDFADGSELVEMPDYVRVPNSSEWLIGLTNLHGMVIPIFDLTTYFGIDHDDGVKEKKMMITLGHGENAFGLVINGMPKRLFWGKKNEVDISTSPRSIRQYIKAACKIEGHLWFDLKVELLQNELASDT